MIFGVIGPVLVLTFMIVMIKAFICLMENEPFLPRNKKKEVYRNYLEALSRYKGRCMPYYSNITEMDFSTVMSLMQVNPNKWTNKVVGCIVNSDVLTYTNDDGRTTAIKFSYKDYKTYLAFLKREQEKARLEAETAKKQYENQVARDILDDVQKDINKLREQSIQEIEKSTETMRYIIERM